MGAILMEFWNINHKNGSLSSFYRMDVIEYLPFLRENELIARIWVEQAEVPFVINDHELSKLILHDALKLSPY